MNDALKIAGKSLLATGSAVALAAAISAHFEGLRITSYYDPAGILTICYGETLNVQEGDKKTPEQCRMMLDGRMAVFNVGVKSVVKKPMTVYQEAAFTDFAYNVGVRAFSKSTLLKKFNAGDTRGACDGLLQWVYIGRVKLEGLQQRRAVERELCLKGLPV